MLYNSRCERMVRVTMAPCLYLAKNIFELMYNNDVLVSTCRKGKELSCHPLYLHVSPLSGDSHWIWNVIRYEWFQFTEESMLFFVLADLQPNKSYKVRVLLATSAGYPEHMIRLPWYTVRMPRSSSDLPRDNVFLIVHLSTCSQRPTEVLVSAVVEQQTPSRSDSFRLQ